MSTSKPGLLPDHSIRFVLSVLLGLVVATNWLPAQQAKKDDKKPEPAKKEDKTKAEPKKEEKLTPPLLELKGHTDWINKVIYSPDGTRLATASQAGLSPVSFPWTSDRAASPYPAIQR
jgi:hypothetical protein